jgi:superfamily I DNA/RNA helicase
MLRTLPTSIELTPRQRDAVRHRGGNLLVEAAPGSGKTQVIIARCAALLDDGVSAAGILVLTFSRRAASELQDRLARALPERALPDVQTFHGFAARLIAYAGERGRSRRLIADEAERILFEHIVATTPFQTLPGTIADWPLAAESLSAHVDAVRRSSSAARAELAARATPRIADLLALATARGQLRDQLGVADYDDLVAQAVTVASSPSRPGAHYQHILVDEFQNTDPLALALLVQLGGEVFAVGDPAQAIYGFRGAARDALQRARTRLAMQTLSLEQSFRCPPDVCEVARSVWPVPPSLQSSVATAGSFAVRRAASPADEAAFIATAVADARARGLHARDIAVLVRAAEPLARLVHRELADRGIASTRHDRSALTDDRMVDAICRVLDVFGDPTDTGRWIRCLSHPVFDFPALTVRLALDAEPPGSIAAATALLANFDTPALCPGRQFAAALTAAHGPWEAGDPVRAVRTFVIEANLLGRLAAGDERQARLGSGRIVEFLDALADVTDIYRRLGREAHSRAVYEALRNAQAPRRADDGDEDECVRILTIHAAKGLEFAFVVIADAVETHFPQTARADPLLSLDDIALARRCDVPLGTTHAEHLAEERALWYVAATRAKRDLLVTWSETDLAASPQRPSRFIPLAERTRELERPAFRGSLAFDPDHALAEPQTPRPARLARPVPTTAIDAWIACRRQFYYRALLHMDSGDGGIRSALGKLVHRSISRFHEGVRDFRSVAAGAAAGWTQMLQRVAREFATDGTTLAPFDSAVETAALLRAADRLLDRYARALETQARAPGGAFEVVASERRIAYRAGGIDFSGTVDRIDRRATGELSIVDIKTGGWRKENAMNTAFPKLATAVSNDELWRKQQPRASPQLALYGYAEPHPASLVFLFLGARPKSEEYRDEARFDTLDCTHDAAALNDLRAALDAIFFTPWRAGAITELEPTRHGRTCRSCAFTRTCPGFLDEDD